MTLEVIERGRDSATRKTPLLFVHGAWHAAWCWEEHFLTYFAELGYHCVAPSLRGHGNSPGHQRMRRHRIADYVADVASIAATLPAPPILIGHSMGGMVVQKYLASHAAVGGILLASVPPAGVWRTTLRIIARHPLRFLWANLILRLYPLVNTPALAREQFYSDAMSDAEVARYAAKLGDESFMAFIDMLLRLPKRDAINVPLHVIGGELDRIFHPFEVHATARFYGTEARIVERTAHNLMLEPRWPEVADDMHQWMLSLNDESPESAT